MKILNKKGTGMDLVFILVSVVLVISLVFLFSKAMINQVEPVLQNITTVNGSLAMTQIDNQSSTILDYGFAIGFFIILLISILFSFFIQTHPVMFFLTLLLDVFIILIAQIVKTIYSNVLTINIFNGANNSFPLTNWILTNLVIIMVVIVGIQAIFMFSALREGVL